MQPKTYSHLQPDQLSTVQGDLGQGLEAPAMKQKHWLVAATYTSPELHQFS